MTGSCPPFIAEVKTMRGPKLLAARKPDLADEISRPRWIFLSFSMSCPCVSCDMPRHVNAGQCQSARASVSVSVCVSWGRNVDLSPHFRRLTALSLEQKKRSSRASRTRFKLVTYSTRQPFFRYCWHLLSVFCVTRYKFWCWCEWITVLKSVSDRVFFVLLSNKIDAIFSMS